MRQEQTPGARDQAQEGQEEQEIDQDPDGHLDVTRHSFPPEKRGREHKESGGRMIGRKRQRGEKAGPARQGDYMTAR
jgi:hypothetical protein